MGKGFFFPRPLLTTEAARDTAPTAPAVFCKRATKNLLAAYLVSAFIIDPYLVTSGAPKALLGVMPVAEGDVLL